MTQGSVPTTPGCIFCAICEHDLEASIVYEDDDAMVFMALNSVNPGHMLVVPRRHASGLSDLDADSGAHVWAVAQDMTRALRRSTLGCEGINLLVCDGKAACQSVFHLHLHVIPRHAGDGFVLFVIDGTEVPARDRDLLDADAQAVRDALA